jgi:ABC-type phosphate/phosphonate transport system substrate-binding protein
VLAGHVRYVATPVHNAPGCGEGTYRSVVVRRGPGKDMPPPQTGEAAQLPEILAGRLAANEPASMSGYVALLRDCEAAGLQIPEKDDVFWTGSHRESIRAVAAGKADLAAIDCVTWQIAQEHEQTTGELHIAGWTASRPGLPLITSLAMDDDALARIRRAVLSSMEAVVLDPPVEVTPLPDPRP